MPKLHLARMKGPGVACANHKHQPQLKGITLDAYHKALERNDRDCCMACYSAYMARMRRLGNAAHMAPYPYS